MCESTVQNYTSRKNFTCVAKNSKGMESKSELIDVLSEEVFYLSKYVDFFYYAIC